MADSTYDVVIHGGTVVTTAGRTRADIAVRGDAIAAFGPSLAGQAKETIDATGCYVLPGFIDPHVHMSLPVGDLVSSDDFGSGSIAAACGGVTTMIDFTIQQRGVPLEQAVADRRAQADGCVAIDYGLHLTVLDAAPRTLAEIESLAAKGYTSIKLYMAYPGLMVDNETMLTLMRTAARCGAVTMVHAEDQAIVARCTQDLLAAQRLSPASHPLARPPEAELAATERAIALAGQAGAPLYIVHVSCAEALSAVERAMARGQPVAAETCPHYLLLSDREYERPGFEAAKYVMTPPLRSPEDLRRLWSGLAGGALAVVATDHCPWVCEGQKTRGRERFDLIPGGIAGVETRAALVFSEGVVTGKLSLEQYVAVMSTNAARIFGLYPRKGALAVGSDADIVVFDPRRQATIRCRDLHQHVDYTVFEGWQTTGAPVVTVLRGRVAARDGQFVGHVGRGQFVARRRTLGQA
jgi:dihydropyrimidinase